MLARLLESAPPGSINEEVLSSLRDKLIAILPSVAGEGFAERLRSTGFAMLGLTAATGLILVAIFAQPSWPLLEPQPLPRVPDSGSVSRAVPLRARVALASRARAGTGAEGGGSLRGGGNGPLALAPPAGGSAAVADPVVAEPPSGGSGAGSHRGRSESSQGEPESVPETSPSEEPRLPEGPEPAGEGSDGSTFPGNSTAAAAAEHASLRGIEASSGRGGSGGGK
jgi:hypothetical protein